MTKLEKILSVIENYDGSADAFGLRSDDRDLQIGEIFPASRVWEAGEATEELLDGTSVTGIRYAEDAAKALDLQLSVYNYSQPLYLVAGTVNSYGEDEGEYILEDAEVLAIL